MAVLSKQNLKWVIIITYIGIISVSSVLQSPTLKTMAVLALGAICLICEFLSLRSLQPNDVNYKSDSRQTWLLIVLTIALIIVNFLV